MEAWINSQILWPIVTLIVGFMIKMVFDWARRGAGTCENHYKMIVSITELTDSTKSLIASMEKLSLKMEKITDQISSIKTDIALLQNVYKN